MNESRRTILVTGSTRGIGRALAVECARLGHTVLGCGRDTARIGDLRRSLPAPHDFAVVDVADDRAVEAWISGLAKRSLVPDLVINNAALIHPELPLWEIPAGLFGEVMGVNVLGTANVIRHVLPYMIPCGRGVIVNMSSGWGRSVDAGFGLYCATKWAIEGLSRALALDLPAGFACVSLSPGVVDTDMLRSAFGYSAGAHPGPETWAKTAAPFILKIGSRQNGEALTVENG